MADITSDIRGFNTPPEIETVYPTGRIIGVAVIVLALASAGVYSYETGMWHSTPKSAVSAGELPSPTPPQAAQNVAPPPPAAVNTMPAPQAAPVVAPAPAPIVTNTTTTVQTPTKTVRTHTTIVRRPDVKPAVSQKRSVPDQNFVAPDAQNSAVTPEAPTSTPSTPQTVTPQNSNMTPNANPAPTSAAPQQAAPQQAAPQTATPNQSTPNSTDPSNTPSPQ